MAWSTVSPYGEGRIGGRETLAPGCAAEQAQPSKSPGGGPPMGGKELDRPMAAWVAGRAAGWRSCSQHHLRSRLRAGMEPSAAAAQQVGSGEAWGLEGGAGWEASIPQLQAVAVLCLRSFTSDTSIA